MCQISTCNVFLVTLVDFSLTKGIEKKNQFNKRTIKRVRIKIRTKNKLKKIVYHKLRLKDKIEFFFL
jgi:hypothetical protein